MAQAGYTPISLYYSTTASAAPTAGNLVAGELALNTVDEKLYFKNSSGVVKLLASNAGSSGDVVGPASATDNAIARFDGTTGKLIQNSAVTIADTSGDITTAGYVITAAGAVTTPAYTTTGDLNTGLWFPAADTIAASTGGSERLRIDSSGNVGIGTSSPSGKLQIDLGNLSTVGAKSNSGLNITGVSGAVGNIYQIGFGYATGATNVPAAIYAITTSDTGFNYNDICFATRSVTTDTAPTERMRIDSSGNVGIGTTSPGSKLDVKGTLRLSGSTSGYVGLAPAAAAGSTTYTLPSADGSSGQVLSTNGSGTLSWATAIVSGGALGTPSSGTLTNATGLPLTTGVTGTLGVANGGTGQTTYTNGQLLIGNTTGNTLTKATLTAGSGITITNGTGSITIAASVSGYVSTDNGSAAIGTFVYGTINTGGTVASGSTTSSFVIAAPAAFGGTNGYKAIGGTWRNVSGSTQGYDGISDENWFNIFQRIS